MQEQQWQAIKHAFEESSDRSVEDRLRILSDLEPNLRLEVERMFFRRTNNKTFNQVSYRNDVGYYAWKVLICHLLLLMVLNYIQ